MNVVSPSIENVTPGAYDMVSILKHIEGCARVCYKSGSRITGDSYVKFTNMLRKRGHLSTFEHGTVYLTVPKREIWNSGLDTLLINPYTRFVDDCENMYVTTNMRVLVEKGIPNDVIGRYMVPIPDAKHIRRYTFRITSDIGVSRELNRHRVHSISEESTRYVNYVGGGIDVVLGDDTPYRRDEVLNRYVYWKYGKDGPGDDDYDENGNILDFEDDVLLYRMMFHLMNFGPFEDPVDYYLYSILSSSYAYTELVKGGSKPETARKVLPLSTRVESVHTAYADDWMHFCILRASNAGASGHHPDMDIIGNAIYGYIINN